MQYAPGRGLLKVVGILMIIFGSISVVFFLAALGLSNLLVMNIYFNFTAYILISILLEGYIIFLGIMGVMHADKPEKAMMLVILGACAFLIPIFGFVMAGFSWLSIFGFTLPILFLIGAILNLRAPAPPPPVGINPKLIGVVGQFAGRSYPIRPNGIMMGRDAASCEFVFSESAQGISRNHCKVEFNPQTTMFVLYDLGSSCGTFLANGVKVQQGQPVALRPGDSFYLASQGNLFRVSL